MAWYDPSTWFSGGGGGSGDWGGTGTSIGGGWSMAPGMADAGYTLPTSGPSTGTDWSKVASALGDLSKANPSQQQQQTPNAAAVTGGAPSAGVGHPSSAAINALVQMLAQRRQAYFDQAMSGHAQPVRQGTTSGLLGF